MIVNKENAKVMYTSYGSIKLTCVEMSFNGDIITYKTGIGLEIPQGKIALLLPSCEAGEVYDVSAVMPVQLLTGKVDEVVIKYRRLSKPTNVPINGEVVAEILVVSKGLEGFGGL